MNPELADDREGLDCASPLDLEIVFDEAAPSRFVPGHADSRHAQAAAGAFREPRQAQELSLGDAGIESQRKSRKRGVGGGAELVENG